MRWVSSLGGILQRNHCGDVNTGPQPNTTAHTSAFQLVAPVQDQHQPHNQHQQHRSNGWIKRTTIERSAQPCTGQQTLFQCLGAEARRILASGLPPANILPTYPAALPPAAVIPPEIKKPGRPPKAVPPALAAAPPPKRPLGRPRIRSLPAPFPGVSSFQCAATYQAVKLCFLMRQYQLPQQRTLCQQKPSITTGHNRRGSWVRRRCGRQGGMCKVHWICCLPHSGTPSSA